MASEGQDRADALGWGRCPNRPKTFARYHTIPQKVTNVSIYDKEPGRPEGYPGPRPFLLLVCGHVRARHISLAVGGLLKTNTEFVLLEDPQPLQLRGDVLQGVQLAPLACLLVHLPLLSVCGPGPHVA